MTTPLHRIIGSIALLAALGLSSTGCATYTAVKIPGPVADESIQLGQHRSEVEATLRAPIMNEYKDGGITTARYQYKDGPHQASKGRVVLYIAGDVFTAFLSELIFWPIEAYASKQTDRIATAQYDSDNKLVGFAVDRSTNERLIALGTPLPGPAPRSSDGEVASDVPATDDTASVPTR